MGAISNASAAAERGLVLVQVDGLSRKHLQQALDRGLMPNLEQALESGRFELDEFRSGVPSHTGVVEAGVLYGRSTLPSNQWLEKATGEIPNVTGSHSSDLIEESFLAGGARGLIEGGSAYLTPLGGNADRSSFALSDIARARRNGGLGEMVSYVAGSFRELAWRLALHPGEAARSVGRFAVDFVRGVFERKRDDVPQSFVGDRLRPALWSALQNGILTDGSVLAMTQRMKKGDPAIFIDLPGFDDIGHALGPNRAMHTLGDIDRNIGRLMNAAERSDRPYNLVFYSDHGQTECVGFSQLYGQTLGAWVLSLLPPAPVGRATATAEPHEPEPAPLPHVHPAEVEGDARMTALDFGTGAHLYFHLSNDPLDGKALEQAYPGLVDKIAAHPGVGFVATRDGAATDIVGPRGRVRVDGDSVTVSGENPLVAFGSESITARQIHDQAHRHGAGDIMVFGALRGEQAVNFSLHPQGGTHGGIGNGQDVAFVIQPAGFGLEMDSVTQASGLYTQLRSRLPSDSPAALP